MELWVRSQDKKHLIKVSNLVCGTYQGTHFINGYSVNEVDNVDLGIYKSEKRCLEVLNEIQNILQPIIVSEPITREITTPSDHYKKYTCEESLMTIQEMSTCVYEMPKE